MALEEPRVVAISTLGVGLKGVGGGSRRVSPRKWSVVVLDDDNDGSSGWLRGTRDRDVMYARDVDKILYESIKFAISQARKWLILSSLKSLIIEELTMFRYTIKNLSIGVHFYMSWTIMRFVSTGRTHRSKVCKVARSTIMRIHFNGVRSKDGDKCKLLRGGKFDSMRTISLK